MPSNIISRRKFTLWAGVIAGVGLFMRYLPAGAGNERQIVPEKFKNGWLDDVEYVVVDGWVLRLEDLAG